jgi:GAF domain-containing protein
MATRRRDSLTALGRLAADIGPALVPAGHLELLESITEAARRLFDARACSMALLTEDDSELHFVMASGEGSDTVKEMRIPAGHGIAGWVVMSGQAIAIDDVTRDPRFASAVAENTGYVPRSILAMPLETQRRVLGVIEVLDRSPERVAASHDMELLAVFAGQAALAIESSTVFRDMGRVLLESLAGASRDEDLAASLRRHAAAAPKPRRQLVELASLFQELGDAGEHEQQLAVRLIREVLAYARARHRE